MVASQQVSVAPSWAPSGQGLGVPVVRVSLVAGVACLPACPRKAL